MNKQVNINDIIGIMREKLDNGGTVIFSPNGNSMYPMLRDGKDTVMLTKPTGKLKRYELPLYIRKDGTYVLHRVVDFDSDESYVMCGDNQFANEHGIKDEDIIAVVTGFCRNGKDYTINSLSYKFYIRFWQYLKYCRYALKRCKRKVVKLFEDKK